MSESLRNDFIKFLRELFKFIEKFVGWTQQEAAVKIQIVFGWQRMTLNVNLLVGQTVPFFVTGLDANGNRTGTLEGGASLAVTLSDDSGVSFTEDAVPSVAPDGGPSIASGVLTALAVDTDTLIASVTNADGSAGPSTEATVTVSASTVVGSATSINIEFGSITTPPSATPSARMKAGKQPSVQFPTKK